jgi:hypothetical protein
MAHEQRTEVPDFIMKLGHLCVEAVILGRVHFHFGLEVSQPLLLSLATLQSGNTMIS